MNTEKLTELTLEILTENKALDIINLDVKALTSTIDRMIVCSAISKRHASALADKLIRALRKAGVRPYGVEGEEQGEWVLVDLTDIVVHIMIPEMREFYNLEKLWSATQAARADMTNHDD